MPAAPPAPDPLARTLKILSRRWTLEILGFLGDGPRRFSEINAAFPGLSERVMWDRLRDLVDAQLIERHVTPGPPIATHYRLTRKASSVRERIEELRDALAA